MGLHHRQVCHRSSRRAKSLEKISKVNFIGVLGSRVRCKTDTICGLGVVLGIPTVMPYTTEVVVPCRILDVLGSVARTGIDNDEKTAQAYKWESPTPAREAGASFPLPFCPQFVQACWRLTLHLHLRMDIKGWVRNTDVDQAVREKSKGLDWVRPVDCTTSSCEWVMDNQLSVSARGSSSNLSVDEAH